MITVGDCNKFKPFSSKLITKEQLAEALESFVNDGVTAKELAEKYNVGEGIINYYISKLLFYTRAKETQTILLHSKI